MNTFSFRLVGVSLVLASFSMPAMAQANPECMGFSNAITLSTANDPAVETNRARRREAEADVEEARSLYRPQISAFARTGAGDVGLIDSAIQNQVGLNASQRVIDFGDAKYARRAARFGVDATVFDIEIAREEAAESSSAAILEILQVSEAMTLTQTRRQYFRDQLEAVESVLEQGGATVSERAEVAAQLANAESFFLSLQSQREQAETRLLIDTGVEPVLCEPVAMEAEFRTLGQEFSTISAAVSQAMANAPELQSLRARADSLAAQRERERRARLPIISVVGSAAYSSFGGGIDNFQLQERVGVDVSVPIFTGNALRARSRRASAREAAAKSEVLERRRQLEEDVRISFRQIFSLQAQLVATTEFEDRSRELFEFAQFEYEAGTRTLPDLVDVRLEYEQSGLRRIAVKFDLMRERLRLLFLTGALA